jgi:hypothetical protein
MVATSVRCGIPPPVHAAASRNNFNGARRKPTVDSTPAGIVATDIIGCSRRLLAEPHGALLNDGSAINERKREVRQRWKLVAAFAVLGKSEVAPSGLLYALANHVTNQLLRRPVPRAPLVIIAAHKSRV